MEGNKIKYLDIFFKDYTPCTTGENCAEYPLSEITLSVHKFCGDKTITENIVAEYLLSNNYSHKIKDGLNSVWLLMRRV